MVRIIHENARRREARKLAKRAIDDFGEEPPLTRNIHPKERVFRLILGIVLTPLAFLGPANDWFLLGLIPLVSGMVGWCLLYQIFGKFGETRSRP